MGESTSSAVITCRKALRAARDSAAAPAVHQAQAAELTETPAAIRKEAEDCLGSDPLRAYLRAGAMIMGEPCVDFELDCADFPVILPLERLDQRFKQRFGPLAA